MTTANNRQRYRHSADYEVQLQHRTEYRLRRKLTRRARGQGGDPRAAELGGK